jgi:enoyl-CoA hydratase/carnithine racemase
MLTARQVPAAEALAIGLVDRLTGSDVAEAALALAGELAVVSLPAQRAVVAAVDAAFDLPLDAGLGFEAERIQALFEEGEAAEGIAAFTEKRSPRFA